MQQVENHIYINKNFGWFIGQFSHNQFHRHYAMQLSIPINDTISIKTTKAKLKTDQAILIKSNTLHQLTSDFNHFLLLVNPASSIGQFWSRLAKEEIQEIKTNPILTLKKVLHSGKPINSITHELNSLIESFSCSNSDKLPNSDERITKAIKYIEEHSDRTIPLEEISNFCNMSKSRFIHLFKNEMNITYRRAQLWYKITHSFSDMGKSSFTEIAYKNGFADGAHFSRTFKENFGFSPRDFMKISQFIQV